MKSEPGLSSASSCTRSWKDRKRRRLKSWITGLAAVIRHLLGSASDLPYQLHPLNVSSADPCPDPY